MRHVIFNLWLLGFTHTPIQGEHRNAYPSFFGGHPPVNILDCMLRYFACSDDHTYGKWPMNSRICLRDYQICIAQIKWNQKVTYRGGVKIISPVNNPVYSSEQENGRLVKFRTFGYLHTFSYFKTICTNDIAKLSCGRYGKIEIIFVFFGRFDSDVCVDKISPEYVHDDCIVDEADKSVYLDCNGKNECMVSTKKLNPKYCRDKFPYLQVKYTCQKFQKPIVKSSGSFNSSFVENAVVDQNIDSFFSTSYQGNPWIHLILPKSYKVKEVIVIANKGKNLVDIRRIEVKLFNGFTATPLSFEKDLNSCIKKTPWDLTFRCKSMLPYAEIVVYSAERGILSVKEITIVLKNEMGDRDGGKGIIKKKIPYERSDKNIYSIYDKSCSKELLDISCSVYGGTIEIIESIIGRTRGNCDPTSQDLECSIRIKGSIPSCLGKPKCKPVEDRLLRDTNLDLNQQTTCNGINYYEIRYTCTGIPKPKVTTSSVDNGFTSDFILYKEEFATNYFSSKFEDSPWIHIFFHKVLAVVGIQFTVDLNERSATVFENIQVRVGDQSVISKSDINGNAICGFYKGPPKTDQTYIVLNCGSNDNFLLGRHMTVQKIGKGVLKVRDILILLLPESNIKEVTHIGGILIEDLFCKDYTSITCLESGGGEIIPVTAYAGSSKDPNICDPTTNIVDIKTDCEISLTSIVQNNCRDKETCNIDLVGTDTCPNDYSYRRILFRCTSFQEPSGRASSTESSNHEPKYALDGKIVTGNIFLFKSNLEYGPWFEVDLKSIYIIKGVEIIFGDLENIKTSVQISVLKDPFVHDFFRDSDKGLNGSFPKFRSTSICAYLDQIPDVSYSYIRCNNNMDGQFVVLIIKQFTVLVLNELIVLLADT